MNCTNWFSQTSCEPRRHSAPTMHHGICTLLKVAIKEMLWPMWMVVLLHLQVSLTCVTCFHQNGHHETYKGPWKIPPLFKGESTLNRHGQAIVMDKPPQKGEFLPGFLHGCLKISSSREQSCYVWVDHNGRVHREIWRSKKRQPGCRHRRKLWCWCFIFGWCKCICNPETCITRIRSPLRTIVSFWGWTPWTGTDKPAGTSISTSGKPLGYIQVTNIQVTWIPPLWLIGWTKGGRVQHKSSAREVTHPSRFRTWVA